MMLRDDWDTWRLTTTNSYGDLKIQKEAFRQCMVIERDGKTEDKVAAKMRQDFWVKAVPWIEAAEVPGVGINPTA